MSNKWWTHESEHTDEHGDTSWHRAHSTGTVWDEYVTHDEGGKRRYRAQTWVMQHEDDDYPYISLWTHNGSTPPPVLSVEDARLLGHALLEAAELVDRERDTAIQTLLEGGAR